MTITFNHGWTDEQLALKKSAMEFTKREVSPNIEQWERDGEIPRDFQKKLAHAGLLGIGAPEEVGGDGGSLMDICAAQEGFMEAGWSGGLMASAFTHGIGSRYDPRTHPACGWISKWACGPVLFPVDPT